jgi:hypothetical protein
MVDPLNAAEKLARELRSLFQDELRSVVLFGSQPRGEAVPGVSDLNVLILLETIGAAQLARVAPLAHQWIRAGNSPPQFYSWREWQGMSDTFAIEIADMQDARLILDGVDPVTHETPRMSDLRLHAEREIRETLLNLRLSLMLAAQNPLDVGAVLLNSLPSFGAYMRAALRLSGESPGKDTPSVIERIARRMGADPNTFLMCWETRISARPLSVEMTDPLLESYAEFVQKLEQYVDGLDSSISPSPAPQLAATLVGR